MNSNTADQQQQKCAGCLNNSDCITTDCFYISWVGDFYEDIVYNADGKKIGQWVHDCFYMEANKKTAFICNECDDGNTCMVDLDDGVLDHFSMDDVELFTDEMIDFGMHYFFEADGVGRWRYETPKICNSDYEQY